MRLKSNHVVIPALVFLVLWLGKFYTSLGMDWYHTALRLPRETPPDWVFPIVWFFVFVSVVYAGLIVWNTFRRDFLFYAIIALFFINGILNVLWTRLFFYQHELYYALIDAVALETTLIFLIVSIFPRSRRAGTLLLPYAIWVAFAIYLNYQITLLN